MVTRGLRSWCWFGDDGVATTVVVVAVVAVAVVVAVVDGVVG